jgi:hypothetical protein
MEDIVPGQRATVEVALAVMGGTPSATRAGKVISVPPPAMAFIIAPRAAATATAARKRGESTARASGKTLERLQEIRTREG